MIQELQDSHQKVECELHQQLEEQELANQDLHVGVAMMNHMIGSAHPIRNN